MLVENGEHTPALMRAAEPTLGTDDKVVFLMQGAAYHPPVAEVAHRETHMSHVFLAGERAYKLKKPVRFPYLDFSTLVRREAACRAELVLNRRLAADVYQDVVPLVRSPAGLAIGRPGEIVDWLVVMRRLDESRMLDQVIAASGLQYWHLDCLVETLMRFYRHARRVCIPAAVYLAGWRDSLAYNRRILLDPRLGLPPGLVCHVDAVQRRFLAERPDLLAARLHQRRVVDGHGDLRPEHISIGHQVRIIDCLEFNPTLRMVDPLDEIAFLCVECERLGAAWAGAYLRRRLVPALDGQGADLLFAFYRCHRATLRARLAIAHLLEKNPRTPAKWPPLTRNYLRLAAADAVRIERGLSRCAIR